MTISPLRRAGRLAANSALVAVLLGCAAWLAPSALGYDTYVITGGSMSGTFERGSVAIERQVPVGQLKVGDVITYAPPADAGTTDLVTHRIDSIRAGEHGEPVYRTKGDANPQRDPWKFSLDQDTQPVVQLTVPYVGHVLIALADRQTRMLLIGGPAALVALLALGELVGGLRRTSGPAAEAESEGAEPRAAGEAPVQRDPAEPVAV